MSDFTQGWDAVLALAFSAVNETFTDAIKAGLIPKSGQHSYTFAAGSDDTDVNVSASVGPWRVVEAHGAKVVVQIILTGGSLVYDKYTVDLTRLDYKVTVPLVYDEMEGDGGPNYMLTLDFDDKETIAVPNMSLIASQVPRNDLMALNAALTDFFFDALSGGAVDLVRVDSAVLGEGRKWLAPKAFSCSGMTRAAGDGALALLISTVNPPPRSASPLGEDSVPAGMRCAFILSNELLAKCFVVPAFAKALNIPIKNVNVRPGRPWAMEITNPAVVENATVHKARAVVSKGELRVAMTGVAKFWGGATIAFDITATYDVVVGGDPSAPKIAFRRLTRDHAHKIQVSTASKAVTLGSTGLQTSRAEELMIAVMNLVAPQRLGNPFALDFMTAVKWPFGRRVAPKFAKLPDALQLIFDPV